MAEPARKVYDDDDVEKPLSARTRADQRWSMAPPQEDSDDSPEPDESTDADDQGSARERADQRWGMAPDELRDAEEGAGDQSATKADQDEKSKAAPDDQVGDGFTDDDDGKGGKKKRKFLTRKKAIGSGIAGLGIFGILGVFNVLQGPIGVIHFWKSLDSFHFQSNNDFANDRSNRLLRYLRYRNPEDLHRRRLSGVMNRYADKIEARWARAGFYPEYNGPGNRLSAFRVAPGVDVRAFEADGLTVSEPDAAGLRRIEITGDMSGRQLKRLHNRISDAANYNRTISAINTRVLGRRGAVSFKLFSDRQRRADEKLSEFYERVRKEIADYYKRGSSALRIRASGTETDSDGDGEPDSTDPDSQGEADSGNDTADGVREDVDNGGIDAGRNHLRNDFDRGSGVISTLCMVKGIAQRYPAIQYANIVLPLLRTGAGIMSMGSQVAAGKGLNLNEVSAVASRFFSQEEADSGHGGSWTTARSIQAQFGQPQVGPDIIPSARPSRLGNNRALNAINNITGRIPGFGTACSVSNNPVGGVIIDFIGGGPGAVIGGFFFEQLLSVLGFDPIEFFARLIAGEEVDGNASGAMLGNFANYGARIASNDAMIGMGGQQLTEGQEQTLDFEVALAEQQQFQNLALSERLFSFENPKSLISRIALSNMVPRTANGAVNQLALLPLNLLSKVGASISRISTQPTMALATNNGYDYGFPMFGYTADERDDPANDPIAVAEEFDVIINQRTAAEERCAQENGVSPGEEPCNWIPSNVGEFNQVYEKCFGANIVESYGPDLVEAFQQIRTVNYFSKDSEDPETGRPDYCDDDTADDYSPGTPGYYDGTPLGHSSRQQAANDLRVFRFYLADTVVGHSMLCYEGEQSSCDLFRSGGSSQSSSGGSGGLGISPDGFVFPLRTTKVTITGNQPRWCYQSQSNCHHHYNAADIFAPTGTPVVAAQSGIVIRAADNDTSSVGSRVTIKGDDGNLYYYAHMGEGTIRVSKDQRVEAGIEIGQVGTRADAVGTPQHLHFDVLPPSYDSRPSCSGGACQAYPFINPQPALTGAFNNLPS